MSAWKGGARESLPQFQLRSSFPSSPAVKHDPDIPGNLCNRVVHACACARPATTVITTDHFPLASVLVGAFGGCLVWGNVEEGVPNINLPLGGAEGGLILGAPCANGVTQHKVLHHQKKKKSNQIFLMIHNEYLVGNP